MRCIIFIILLINLSALSADEEWIRQKMIHDLEIIKNTYDICYAPSDWKKQFTGWNLEEEADKTKSAILTFQTVTIKSYHQIIKRFLLTTCDYHVIPLFHSTEYAYLPFRIQSADKRYFVTSVNTGHRLYSEIPLQPGDEIISIDQVPVHQAVMSFREQEFGLKDCPTDQSMAEGFFTSRLGSLGYDIPSGPVTITVVHKGSTQPKSYVSCWDYYPEQIDSAFLKGPKAARKEDPLEGPLSEHPYFNKKMSTPIAAAINKLHNHLGCSDIDMFGSVLPIGDSANKIIHQPNCDFYKAYIYLTPKGQRIGYIRIPTYQAGEEEALEFSKLIGHFQNATDALVLDQLNNPGGLFFFMYAIASMLTDAPLIVPHHKQTLTQEDIAFALQYLHQLSNVRTTYEAQQTIGRTLQGYHVDFKTVGYFKDHFNALIEEWNSGKVFTRSLPLYGIEAIEPHPQTRYTKPLLILVNEMDFSCADFFPAIMQDNKRALLLGTRIAGAGGFVLKASHPNRFGIANYSYTGSIAERSDKRPIENLGVEPDIIHKMTANDLSNNYADFHSAIQKAIDQLVPVHAP